MKYDFQRYKAKSNIERDGGIPEEIRATRKLARIQKHRDLPFFKTQL